MNYRYVVMTENPPVVYIYEIAAENKNSKKIDVLLGEKAQEYIDVQKHEILEDAASWRVHHEPKLWPHREFILGDWPEGDEHLVWVVTAPIEEILDWVTVK